MDETELETTNKGTESKNQPINLTILLRPVINKKGQRLRRKQ